MRLLAVLIISGILGFRVGMVGFPDWQVAVETAQVVAGLVDYPPNNVFYIYHTHLWTALHHVIAAALVAGAGEITISHIVSGVEGMLTFQALAMFVFALSRNAFVAIGAAALVFFTRSAEYGVVYPIFLPSSEHTYGVIGLALSVLTVALLGAGCHRAGALLLGMTPCIHPALGAWTGLVVAVAIASDFRRLRDELRPALPWFLAGCGVTLVSLLIQFALVYEAPVGMTPLSPADFSAFVRLWDGHRAAVNIRHDGVLLNVAALLVAASWLMFRSIDVPLSTRLLLRVSAAASLVALALIPVSWIPPEKIPTSLVVLMPGRLLNFGAMTFVALLIGLVASRPDAWSRFVLLFLSCGLLAADRSMLWGFLESHRGIVRQSAINPLHIAWIAGAAALAGAAFRLRAGGASTRLGSNLRYLPGAAYAASVAVLAVTVVMTWHQSQQRPGSFFSDRTNDVFFRDVAAGSGVLLLAGDLHLIQLKTRRPVLIDSGALDTIMYSLETGAAMQRILRDVYGLDLYAPPTDAIGAGRIPALSHRETWQSYSLEKWRTIRRDFGVTQVLAYADWSLDLPIAAHSRRLLLYDIPER